MQSSTPRYEQSDFAKKQSSLCKKAINFGTVSPSSKTPAARRFYNDYIVIKSDKVRGKNLHVSNLRQHEEGCQNQNIKDGTNMEGTQLKIKISNTKTLTSTSPFKKTCSQMGAFCAEILKEMQTEFTQTVSSS